MPPPRFRPPPAHWSTVLTRVKASLRRLRSFLAPPAWTRAALMCCAVRVGDGRKDAFGEGSATEGLAAAAQPE